MPTGLFGKFLLHYLLFQYRNYGPMELRYHGIEYDEKKGEGWLHLGMFQLLLWLKFSFCPPYSANEPRPLEWPDKWLDAKFSQAVTKFQDTFYKLDRVAKHFGRCVEVARDYSETKKMENLAQSMNAIKDIPLYLDLMLIYLRIQADCLSNVIPNLYGQLGKKEGLPRDSFRKQYKWFKEKRPDFDPDYTAILKSEHHWFDILAGKVKGQGFRDLAIHYRGVYQLGWRETGDPRDFAFVASLMGDSGLVCQNIVPELKTIVEGYFSYLDQTFIHFTKKFRAKLENIGISENTFTSQTYMISGGPLASFWLYPKIKAN